MGHPQPTCLEFASPACLVACQEARISPTLHDFDSLKIGRDGTAPSPRPQTTWPGRMGLFDTIVMPLDGGSFQTNQTRAPHFATYHVGDRIDCPDGVHSETCARATTCWFQVHHGRLIFAGRQAPQAFIERLPWDAPQRYAYDPAAEALHRVFMCIATEEFGPIYGPLKEVIEFVAVQGLQNFLHETNQHHVIPDGFEPQSTKRRRLEAALREVAGSGLE